MSTSFERVWRPSRSGVRSERCPTADSNLQVQGRISNAEYDNCDSAGGRNLLPSEDGDVVGKEATRKTGEWKNILKGQCSRPARVGGMGLVRIY